ncbi:MAG: flagellar motor switch protein FliN [Hyphomicrobiales bacterium]|nr:flagellar motor switch protein FliN [Hyphomicrobiales bacterium]
MADETPNAAEETLNADVQLMDTKTVGGRSTDPLDLETVYDIPVEITVVLGTTHMPISQLLKLGRGAVIELERKIGEPVDVLVNDRLVARGEVVIVEDRIGITMTDIIKSENKG